MVKKIITGTLLLVIVTQVFAATRSFAPTRLYEKPVLVAIAAGAPKFGPRQKRLKKKIIARQHKMAHEKTDRHLAKVVHRITSRHISGTRLSSQRVATGIPTIDETSDLHLSAEFKKHKGQLFWPLSGTVSMPFGAFEYMPNIQHNNVGITIDAAEGTSVKAVYQGEVTSIANIGGVWCVILRHGNYYSAYSNLVSTNVVKGQQVSAGEELGSIGDTRQLEFLLMDDNREYVDPGKWLRR